MKKKFLSLLMAFCLMLSLAPAAFAVDSQPETITLPNGEVREIPDVEEPNTPSALSADTANTITITDVDDIWEYDDTVWYSNNTIYIAGDLNFSEYSDEIAEWDGFIPYFYGTMEGVKGDYDGTGEERYPIISGIPNNCGLIYGIIGGTIQNLTFEHAASTDGGAYFITFMPTSMSGVSYALTMRNVTVTGDISLTGSDQSNYSPFVFCVSGGGITMENCVNEADISGSIYGSVFYGYYPLYATSYVFDNCVNYGDITMQYAGMFFGNSSTLETKLTTNGFNLTISGCANYGEIRGTSGASYLVAPVASSSIGTVANTIENVLNPDNTATETSISNLNISKLTKSSEGIESVGSLCIGSALTGFAATLDSTSRVLTVTRPTDETTKAVDHYTVAISAYVNLWYAGDDITDPGFYGTDRYTVTQDISVDSLPTLDNSNSSTLTFAPTLKVYGFADSNAGTSAGTVAGQLVRRVNGTLYYQILNNIEEGDFSLYVSSAVDDNGPVGGGVKNAQIVTVAAYDVDGTMLDCITVTL